MALGNRAGYPKVDLADLGLSALFHDVGKCAIALDVLNKPGEFTQEEWAIMRSHPIEGVFTLVKARGINNVPARMASASRSVAIPDAAERLADVLKFRHWFAGKLDAYAGREHA